MTPGESAGRIMKTMKAVLLVAAIAAALFLIDRAALAMEQRGWIYWRRKKASPGTRAAAFLEMQSLIEPGRKQVVEAQREQAGEDDDAADGDAGS